jgi:hypothetical protein
MKTYYLYLKTHIATGLKYLGQTCQDPHLYKGSGTYWKRHLKKYPTEVHTEILFETKDRSQIRERGLYYSSLWNIAESKHFANLCPEDGAGGHTRYTPERNAKISKANKGRKNTWTTKGCNKGKVVAYDINSGEHVAVTTDVFMASPNLTGLGAVNKGKPKPAYFAENIRKKYAKNPKAGKCSITYDNTTYNSIRHMHRETSIPRLKIAKWIKNKDDRIKVVYNAA